MFRIIALLVVVARVSFLAVPEANAGSIGSSTRLKIHRAKLQSVMLKAGSEDSRALELCETGNVDIASIDVERGTRAPREVAVVIQGDVINLNDGRGNRVCR
ncbi:hypothetical protein MK489_13745 [Myxococcota bacterium]|nr:hypothetical protein [Myxococcota bacterium]